LVFALLGCYTAYFGGGLPMFRNKLSVPLQGSWTAGTLKMGLVGCPEKTVNSYQHTLLNDPEERTP